MADTQLRDAENEDARQPSATIPPLPPDALIIVPVRGIVLFPHLVLPITLARPRSIAAAQQAVRDQRQVGILMQRAADIADPAPIDMHRMGTVASIVRYLTAPDGTHHLVCQGDQRFQVTEFLNGWPFFVARVVRIPEPESRSPEIEARFINLKAQTAEAISLLPQAPPELAASIQSITSPAALADLAVTYMDVTPEEKQEVLETVDLAARMDKVARMLAQRIEILRLSNEIGQQTRTALDKRQREALLREQMAAIQRQLGEGDEGKAAEIAELNETITKAGMPEEVEQQARKELRRLERMPEAAAEYGMVRTYLDWLIELPWRLPEPAPIDIAEARRILDEDHYGLEKIKRRIIEYLAVRKLAPQGKAPILCFVGPPGVGKTSLGQSIARAMNRKFVRVSLGGVHDEAEIRGHRRTYIGSMPGKIIQSMRKAKTSNIPPSLMDRMEIIRIAGYTEDEKVEIARKYLIPNVTTKHGLDAKEWAIDDEALLTIIRRYTREAGVRHLERELSTLIRKAVKQLISSEKKSVKASANNLAEYLGVPKYRYGEVEGKDLIGVVIGLARTNVGGELLTIEAAVMPGKGRMMVTGNLRVVMKESISAAAACVRSRAVAFGIEPPLFDKRDIHVHVPEGATPKDGPSAGVAMVTAIVSVMTGILSRRDVAMTGEITLRGRVLPIGGLKEKLLAALRGGIKTVLIPEENVKDLVDISDSVKNSLEIIPVSRMDEVLARALMRAPEAIEWDESAVKPAPAAVETPAVEEEPPGLTAH